MSTRRSVEAADGIAALIVFLMFVALIGGLLWIGGICFEYTIWCVFGKDAPFAVDIIGGVLTGEACTVIAVFCFFLWLCGAHFPLV